MTYPYAVKFNGKWYRPNEEVPDTKVEEKPTSVNVLLDERAIQPVISQVKEVQPVRNIFGEQAVEDEPKRRKRKREE